MQSLTQTIVFPDPVQVGIRFQNMEMSIHRLPFIRIFFAQAHVGYLLPLTGKSFLIAILYRVKAVLFNIIEQSYSIRQCFFITRCTVIFAQSVDGKTNGIHLFLRIQRITFGSKTPIYAPEIAIIETIDQISFGMCSHIQIFLFTKKPVSC